MTSGSASSDGRVRDALSGRPKVAIVAGASSNKESRKRSRKRGSTGPCRLRGIYILQKVAVVRLAVLFACDGLFRAFPKFLGRWTKSSLWRGDAD